MEMKAFKNKKECELVIKFIEWLDNECLFNDSEKIENLYMIKNYVALKFDQALEEEKDLNNEYSNSFKNVNTVKGMNGR